MHIYTLSELCSEIGEVLSESLAPSYWVRAEISSLSVKGGHMYLELAESAKSQLPIAKMRATCWAGTQELICTYFESETGQRLQAGMKVLVEAEVQWHDVYGLSLSILNIDPSYTLGDIARQRQQTIAQLQADGLLDAQQLLPLPTLIRRLAVISSPDAAGYEDFKHQLDSGEAKIRYRFTGLTTSAKYRLEYDDKDVLKSVDTPYSQYIFDKDVDNNISFVVKDSYIGDSAYNPHKLKAFGLTDANIALDIVVGNSIYSSTRVELNFGTIYFMAPDDSIKVFDINLFRYLSLRIFIKPAPSSY